MCAALRLLAVWRGGSEPVRPPTGNAQEAERRATGGSRMARKPRGPPVQTEAAGGLWPLGSLALGVQ